MTEELTIKEAAEALQISPETVKRDWRFAKVWLLRAMNKEVRETSGEDTDGC